MKDIRRAERPELLEPIVRACRSLRERARWRVAANGIASRPATFSSNVTILVHVHGAITDAGTIPAADLAAAAAGVDWCEGGGKFA